MLVLVGHGKLNSVLTDVVLFIELLEYNTGGNKFQELGSRSS